VRTLPEAPDLPALVVTTLEPGDDHEGVRLQGLELSGADLPDLRLDRCVLAEVTLSGAGLRRVLRRCKLDAVTLRFARLAQVRFEDCLVRSLDLTRVDAAGYDAVRPGYPAEAAHWLVGEPDRLLRVLDLGAGTGKLTRRLAGHGHDVIAVDPSPTMLTTLSAALPEVDVREGTGEALPLEDASVDAVTVAQAWHWFDVQRVTAELARLLRPGGTLGIVWNIRDGRVPWVTELGALAGEGTAGDSDTAEWGTPLQVPAPFSPAERRLFTHDLVLTPEQVTELAASWSVVQLRPDAPAVLEAVRALAERVADGAPTVSIPHFCRCFRFRLPG
jgi:SAM-dependent methyltransferase